MDELRAIIRAQERRIRRLEGLDADEEDDTNGHRNAI